MSELIPVKHCGHCDDDDDEDGGGDGDGGELPVKLKVALFPVRDPLRDVKSSFPEFTSS